jgi:hypothetical protein
MSQLENGTEVLVMLALPLDVRLVAELCTGIADAAERAGYTDVSLLTDGTHRIVARRQPRGGR